MQLFHRAAARRGCPCARVCAVSLAALTEAPRPHPHPQFITASVDSLIHPPPFSISRPCSLPCCPPSPLSFLPSPLLPQALHASSSSSAPIILPSSSLASPTRPLLFHKRTLYMCEPVWVGVGGAWISLSTPCSTGSENGQEVLKTYNRQCKRKKDSEQRQHRPGSQLQAGLIMLIMFARRSHTEALLNEHQASVICPRVVAPPTDTWSKQFFHLQHRGRFPEDKRE